MEYMLTFHILNVCVDKTQPRQFKFTFNKKYALILLFSAIRPTIQANVWVNYVFCLVVIRVMSCYVFSVYEVASGNVCIVLLIRCLWFVCGLFVVCLWFTTYKLSPQPGLF